MLYCDFFQNLFFYHHMIDYDKLALAIEKVVTTSSLYWQSLALILCFIFSYFIYRITKYLFISKIIASSLRKNIQLNRFFTRYFIPLYYPILTSVLLALGLSIFNQIFKEAVLLLTTLNLILLF